MNLARVALPARPPWIPGAADLRLPVAEPTASALAPDALDLGFVLEERWRHATPPLTARLPFHYHRLPPRLRRAAARLLQLGRREGPFPRPPFEPALDAVRWYRGERARWPQGKRYALLLTHDVDTVHGARLIPEFAELERRAGVRSTFFVCSHHYPLDLELLVRLERDGFEVASHGDNHDNRLAFVPAAERDARLAAITAKLRPAVGLAGFRSPSLCRTPGLFASLARLFAYDSSAPDVDLEGEGGCATVLPFRIGPLVEIPITLPMESSLLYRGVAPREIFEHWTAKLDWIRRVGGVATALLHTEPQLGGHPELRALYGRWLAGLPPEAWVTTPRALLAQLDASGFWLRPDAGRPGEEVATC